MASSKHKFNLRENLEDKFIAFIDVLGFSELVGKKGPEAADNLDSYFSKITDELQSIGKQTVKIQSFLISDSIILIAPKGLDGLKKLITVVRRIQSALLWRKIILRGAISFGPVYYNPEHNIIVGRGYIRAFKLEGEAIFPRVIIDPAVIKLVSLDKAGFLKLLNGTTDYNFESRLIYAKSEFTKISDDGIFIDYANKTAKQAEINQNIVKVYELIVENLYTEQKLYSKYIWLRDYYIESLQLTASKLTDESPATNAHKKQLRTWINRFQRL